MVEVRKYTEADRESVEAFLLNTPSACIFQSPRYYDVLTLTDDTRPYYFLAFRDKAVCGCMLCNLEGQAFDKAAFISGILHIKGCPVVGDGDSEAACALLNAANKIKPRPVFIQIAPVYEPGKLKEVYSDSGFEFRPHLSLTIDLQQSDEEIWQRIHKSKRYNIHNAANKGLYCIKAQKPDEITAFLQLLHSTYKRLNLPQPNQDYLLNILDIMPESAYLLNIYDSKQKLLSGQLLLIYNSYAYCSFFAFDKTNRKQHPAELSYYEAIKLAKRLGCKQLDLGGGGNPDKPYGVRDFKLALGAEAANTGHYIKVLRPRLFKLLKAIYRLFYS